VELKINRITRKDYAENAICNKIILKNIIDHICMNIIAHLKKVENISGNIKNYAGLKNIKETKNNIKKIGQNLQLVEASIDFMIGKEERIKN